MDQDATWYDGRPRPGQHCVRCGETAARIKVPLVMEVDLGPSHIVLDGEPAPLPKRGHSSPISARVCCGQTVGWIKMPLCMMVGLGPGNIVFDADPAPTTIGTAPNFRPMSIVAKRSPISATAEHLFTCGM